MGRTYRREWQHAGSSPHVSVSVVLRIAMHGSTIRCVVPVASGPKPIHKPWFSHNLECIQTLDFFMALSALLSTAPLGEWRRRPRRVTFQRSKAGIPGSRNCQARLVGGASPGGGSVAAEVLDPLVPRAIEVHHSPMRYSLLLRGVARSQA